MRTLKPRDALTDCQSEVLHFMWGFYMANDMLPTYREIASHRGCYLTAAMGHVAALERKGYIERNASPGKFRFTVKGRVFCFKPDLQAEAA